MGVIIAVVVGFLLGGLCAYVYLNVSGKLKG